MNDKIRYEERSLQGEDGTTFFLRQFIPSFQRGILLIIHGLGEHSGRYMKTAETIASSGLEVLVPDLRGHGQTGGPRCHVGSFEEYVRDLAHLLQKEGKERVFILGHSMGGLILALFLFRHQEMVEGAIFSSPLFGVAVKVPRAKEMAGKILSKVLPRLSLANEVDPNLLSHDREVVRAYVEDPLVSRKVTTGWYTALLGALFEADKMASRINVPVLMLLGTEDQLISVEAARIFFDRLGGADHTLKIYEGFYHEALNETKRDIVLSDLSHWLEERLPAPRGQAGHPSA